MQSRPDIAVFARLPCGRNLPPMVEFAMQVPEQHVMPPRSFVSDLARTWTYKKRGSPYDHLRT